MRQNRIISFFLISVLALSLGGCYGVNGNFKQVRNEILNSIDQSYTKNIEFSVGNNTIKFAGDIVAISDDNDAEFAASILDKISKVQVGIYEFNQNFNEVQNSEINFKLLKTATDNLNKRGWQFLVRAADHGEMTAVMINENQSNQLRKMFVINIVDDEIILAELTGDLNEIIEVVIREKGENFDWASNY